MTPNLDALAKLAPFVTVYSSAQDAVVIEGAGCEQVDWSDAEAALNEWAELRAYRERTEAALVTLTALLEAVFAKDVNSPVDDVLYKMDVELNLYREPVREPGQGAT